MASLFTSHYVVRLTAILLFVSVTTNLEIKAGISVP